jgi:hypothetical protein
MLTFDAGAGKPHHFICSKCRNPGSLIYCATCSRSYHVSCLSAPPSAEAVATWACPACQERTEALALAASHPSRPASVDHSGPSPNAGLIGPTASGGHSSPLDTSSSTKGSIGTKSPLQTYRQQNPPASASTESGSGDDNFTRERNFLTEHGGFATHEVFSLGLLVQLRNLMSGAEYQAQMRREMDNLRRENAYLKRENHQLQTELGPQRPHPGSTYGLRGSPSTSRGYMSDSIDAPKPLDVSEKSWDRIISDAF